MEVVSPRPRRPMQRLDPKNDLVFKLLLTRDKALLRHMLEGILGRPIQDVEPADPIIPGELSTDKFIILDVRAILADNSRVDLEMQLQTRSNLAARLVYYAARDYADQLRRGEGYHQLTPTAGIVWLLEPLVPSVDRFHSIFELRERHTHTLLSDHLAIHVLQLSGFRPSEATGYDARVERWARFLLAETDAEFDQLASEDPIMSTAKETLEQLSMDPDIRRRAREREDSIKFYTMSLAESEARGEARGKAEGKAEVLLKLLRLRFNSLPEAARARVESATFEQLDKWIERVLTAQTLDGVLAP